MARSVEKQAAQQADALNCRRRIFQAQLDQLKRSSVRMPDMTLITLNARLGSILKSSLKVVGSETSSCSNRSGIKPIAVFPFASEMRVLTLRVAEAEDYVKAHQERARVLSGLDRRANCDRVAACFHQQSSRGNSAHARTPGSDRSRVV